MYLATMEFNLVKKKIVTITNLPAFEIYSNTVIFLFIKVVWLKVQTLEPD